MPELHVHRRRALDAVEAAEASGATRAWVVLPSGAGRTLVGLETARRRGAPTVVLSPNKATQAQWVRDWDAGSGRPGRTVELTSLTYPALATTEDRQQEQGPPVLHADGRALLDRLEELDDLTLVLDDCCHPFEVWGPLFREVLDELPQAFVLGLSATPPGTLTPEQRSLAGDLFGAPVHSASIPAAVRDGDLAPFAELAWLTTPTQAAEEGRRFTDTATELSDPAPGSTGLLTRVDGQPDRPATDPDRDDAVVRRTRQVLRSRVHQPTRSANAPVDRLLARSEAETAALAQIVQAEHRNLGDRLRMLVLCDETAPPQPPQAQLALENLRASVPHLHPLLVTGTTVAGSPETLRRLRAFAGDDTLAVRGDRLVGSSAGAELLPWVIRFFEQGHTRVLVGTPDLLATADTGTVTGLVDLATATTARSVVQARGRALRSDPGWPEKVALVWSVVCVSEEHADGARDWDRFVRTHEHSVGLGADGEIVSGVGRVDPAFSPDAAPPVGTFGEVNARMLARAEQRPAIREAWAVGTPYADTLVHTLRVRTATWRDPRPGRAPVVLHGDRLDVRDRRPSPWRPHPVIAVGVVLAALAFLLNLTPTFVIAIGVGTMLGLQTTVAVDRGRVLAEDLARPPGIEQVACAVADALVTTGLSPRGADAVRVGLGDDGEWRCALADVEPEVSAAFVAALDEAVSAMASPRYVVPRWVLSGPVDNTEGVRAALGRLRADGEAWHPVPAVLGGTEARAQAFARAWDHWVGGGKAVYTGSPPGQGVLVSHRGSDPFDATTEPRVQWR